jgi:hypothetical protein
MGFNLAFKVLKCVNNAMIIFGKAGGIRKWERKCVERRKKVGTTYRGKRWKKQTEFFVISEVAPLCQQLELTSTVDARSLRRCKDGISQTRAPAPAGNPKLRDKRSFPRFRRPQIA